MNCFVIQRQVTKVFYTIRGEQNKPSIIAFKKVQNAKNMLKLINTIDHPSTTKQKLVVIPVNQKEFINDCNKNKLNVVLFSEINGEISSQKM